MRMFTSFRSYLFVHGMVPLQADGGCDVDARSARLLLYRHEFDHFGLNMLVNTSLMLVPDA
jgi:hypothetical protein